MYVKKQPVYFRYDYDTESKQAFSHGGNDEQKKNDTIIPVVIAIAEEAAEIMFLLRNALGPQPVFIKADGNLIALSAV